MTLWQERARCLAALRPAGRMPPGVREFLDALLPSQPVLVGCSGGADSVFLVLALLAWAGEDASRLVVGHYNHGLRGAESDADEAFAAEMAAGLGIRFRSGRAPDGLAPDEASLRQARYGWLSSVYRDIRAGALAVGQQADDLVESLLLAVFTGSGPSGLASPMPVRRFGDETRLRPLLNLQRGQIVRTLESLGIPWREDRSNGDPAYTRNWLRQAVVPLLRERFPQDIYAAAERTRKLMEECVEALDAQLRALDLDSSDPAGLNVARLAGCAPGLIRRAILGWWLRHHSGRILPKGTVDEAVQMVASGRPGAKLSLPGAAGDPTSFLLLDPQLRLLLEPACPATSAAWAAGCHWRWEAGPLFLPGGGVLAGRIERWSPGDAPYAGADPALHAWLLGCEAPLLVRQWLPGDRYRPLGAPGRRKLQDLFVDAKLDPGYKRQLPVLVNPEGEIIWVPGFPPAEALRICQNANSALQLTYLPSSSAFRYHHGG